MNYDHLPRTNDTEVPQECMSHLSGATAHYHPPDPQQDLYKVQDYSNQRNYNRDLSHVIGDSSQQPSNHAHFNQNHNHDSSSVISDSSQQSSNHAHLNHKHDLHNNQDHDREFHQYPIHDNHLRPDCDSHSHRDVKKFPICVQMNAKTQSMTHLNNRNGINLVSNCNGMRNHIMTDPCLEPVRQYCRSVTSKDSLLNNDCVPPHPPRFHDP